MRNNLLTIAVGVDKIYASFNIKHLVYRYLYINYKSCSTWQKKIAKVQSAIYPVYIRIMQNFVTRVNCPPIDNVRSRRARNRLARK